MINPFDAEEEKLVCLASGFVVQEDVADKLLEAEKHGKEQFVKFAQDNLLSTEPNIFAELTCNNVELLCEHWHSNKSSCLGHLSALYVTSKEKCYCFTRTEIQRGTD